MVNWNIIYAHSWPDELYDDMVHFLKHGEYPRILPQHIKRTFQKRVRNGYTLQNDDIVLRVSRPPWIVNRENQQAIVLGRAGDFVFRVIKASMRENILTDLMSVMTKVSTNAHMFVDRVHREGFLGISRRFIHAFMQTHAATVAKRIVTATTNKEVIKSFRPEYPFQHWQIDTMDMIQFAKQNRGYRYIMVVIDIFTKFIYIHPLRNKTQFDVAQVLKKIFLSGDIPDKLHSDNGNEFKGNLGPKNYVGRLCLEYKVKQIFGDAYSPQTQGFVENKNKQIKTLLNYFRINNNSYNYVDILDEVAYTINNSKHAVTGYTPMELHKGRQVEKSYGILANEEDDLERIIDEPTDAELENYYHRANALYDERVNHVKNTIKGVARKREQRQRNQPELRNGAYVYIMSYITHGSDRKQIQGVFIRVGENMYEPNPLKLKNIATQPRTMFSEFELKGPKKYYKFVFRITGIVKDQHAITRYQLSTAPEMTKKYNLDTLPVFLKVDSAGVYKREFNRNHLVLFDPTRTGMPNKTTQIRPNELFVDLTFNKKPPGGAGVESLRFGNTNVTRVDIPGDGDCMFNAVIEGLKRLKRLPVLTPSQKHIEDGEDLRREIVALVYTDCTQSKNRNTYVRMLNASNHRNVGVAPYANCDAYRAHMGRYGTWAGDMELAKIKSVLEHNKINLEVYISVGDEVALSQGGTRAGAGAFEQTVRLLYNGMHYDLLLFAPPRLQNKIPEPKKTKPAEMKPCSIESILKNKAFLEKNKPFIFLVSPERDEANQTVELAVFKVRLLRYSSKDGMWVYETEQDRDNPSNTVTYTHELVKLSPDLYNRMGSEDGWRFVEHNRLLLRSKFKCTRSDRHFARDVDDTPLVDYKNRLVDPSYDVQALLRTKRQRPELRYAFNSYDNNGQPLGVPVVKTGVLQKKAIGGGAFTVKWENEGIGNVDLHPTKYGKLLDEIGGWEFANFNEVFNFQLEASLKNIM